MLNAGVVGFKCFLIHSGVDDFPHVERADLETALQTLQGTDATVLVSYGKIHRLVYVSSRIFIHPDMSLALFEVP